MGFKKTLLAAAAGLAAIGGMGTQAPTLADASETSVQRAGFDTPDQPQSPRRHASRPIAIEVADRYEPMYDGRFLREGRTPKEWGRYLQSRGKQRWDKRTRRL